MAGGGVQLQRPVVAAPARAAGHVGFALERKAQVRAAAGQLQPDGGAHVLGREDGAAAGRQCADDLAVLARHGLDRGHELLVLALRVVDEGHGGRGHGGQRRDLARVVHAQLDHGDAVRERVVMPQAQERQRHADLVVEVALGGQRSITRPTHVGAQDAGDHLRDRGLAVGAGDGDQRDAVLAAPAGGELAQGYSRIGHQQAGHGAQATFGDGGHRAGRLRLGQKVRRVKALAAQGDKQVTGLQAAGVGVHALEGDAAVAHELAARHQCLGILQSHHLVGHRSHRPALCNSAARASSGSENGVRAPFTSW
jgi:hypothetical protein